MNSLDQAARWKNELIAASFAPKRAGFAVRLARRLLWPFIRPYLFFTLDRLRETADRIAHEEARLNALLTEAAALHARFAPVETLLAEAHAMLKKLREESGLQREELGGALAELSRQRTEIAAAVNRQLAVEDEASAQARNLEDYGAA